jgi:hypothetical protein
LQCNAKEQENPFVSSIFLVTLLSCLPVEMGGWR